MGADLETQSIAHGDAEPRAMASAAPAIRAGELFGRYRIRKLLGQGGMSQVYLARDTVLGRALALKLMRPERVSSSEAEHFLREAQITAQLNHPHIVHIHDVGWHREHAFLALEYLEGQSLHLRLREARPSHDEALRIAHAIAQALAHAHDAHIHHCDLKPSNVMLPGDGRPRVVDFGLASHAGIGGRLGGTPDWMAPEQWRGEPTSDRVDVWALAVLVHELWFGGHPFGAARDREARRAMVLEARPKIPSGEAPRELYALLTSSLAREPQARPSARDWVAQLGALVSRAGALGELRDSPYRGLSAFEERHAGWFFGRDAEIDAFIERLRGQALLPIVGPSGSGKSSFLYAGVIPRLRAREHWCVISLRPGVEPFAALAHQLVVAGEVASDERDRAALELARALQQTPSLLAHRLAELAVARDAPVLLACDQLEELFTHARSEAEIDGFVAMLTAAADDPSERVRVVYTLRDDFVGRIPALRALFVLRRLDAAALRRAITAPVERLGFRFEDESIVDAMLREVDGSPFELPLLQFACRRLWDARDVERKVLRTASYRGVAHALAEHADGVMAELSLAQQRTARQLFGRLVIGATTRRTVERDALIAGLADDAGGVLDRLVSARLLVARRIAGEAGTWIELAHESLLATWQQLRDWLAESDEERRLVHELDEAAAFWRRRGESPEQLFAHDELVAARQRIARLAVAVPPAIETFLVAGEQRARAQRRRSQRRRAAVFGLAFVVTAISLWLARTFHEQKLATEQQSSALLLAAGNRGLVDLVVAPFDAPGAVASVDALPALAISLYAADAHGPGRALSMEQVSIMRRAPGEFRVDAIGGPAYIRITGRGRTGESCAASWIRIARMPGYRERVEHVERIELAVPTCRASAAVLVQIPAGLYIHGGAGEPATKFAEYANDVPESKIDLYAFAIDRFEVSNAWFAPFQAMHAITGFATPTYYEPSSGLPTAPVTAIDAYEAEAYCRFMGKRLPSDREWTKAARGGLTIDGVDNPHPRRLYPWGTPLQPSCTNMQGEQDGFDWVAPVDAMACGDSPYGIRQMSGNVAEWIAGDSALPPEQLRHVRGGAVNSPRDLEQATTVFRNAREGRYFDFAIGVRCVQGPALAPSSSWD